MRVFDKAHQSGDLALSFSHIFRWIFRTVFQWVG